MNFVKVVSSNFCIAHVGLFLGSETCKGQQNYYHEKDYDDDYLILGLYANHSFA